MCSSDSETEGVNALFDDFENYLVPDKARNIVVPDDWSYVYGYMLWFFRISHPYLIREAPGDPPRTTHQEILEEEQAARDQCPGRAS